MKLHAAILVLTVSTAGAFVPQLHPSLGATSLALRSSRPNDGVPPPPPPPPPRPSMQNQPPPQQQQQRQQQQQLQRPPPMQSQQSQQSRSFQQGPPPSSSSSPTPFRGANDIYTVWQMSLSLFVAKQMAVVWMPWKSASDMFFVLSRRAYDTMPATPYSFRSFLDAT